MTSQFNWRNRLQLGCFLHCNGYAKAFRKAGVTAIHLDEASEGCFPNCKDSAKPVLGRGGNAPLIRGSWTEAKTSRESAHKKERLLEKGCEK